MHECILIMPGPAAGSQREINLDWPTVEHVPEGNGTRGLYVDARSTDDPEGHGITLYLSRETGLELTRQLQLAIDRLDADEAA